MKTYNIAGAEWEIIGHRYESDGYGEHYTSTTTIYKLRTVSAPHLETEITKPQLERVIEDAKQGSTGRSEKVKESRIAHFHNRISNSR